MAKQFLDSIIVSGTCQATTFSGSGANLTSIPNTALVNSSVTLGSTNVALGSTVTTLAGLNTVSATNLTGTLNTAAQPGITSVGTLSSLGVTGTVTAGGFSGPGTGLTGTAASFTAGAVSSISSAQVTGALGYTPYNSTNPSGFITSSGSITGSSGSCTGNAATASQLKDSNGVATTFNWYNTDNNPTYLWGTSSEGTTILVVMSGMSVSYAATAGSAPANGGTSAACSGNAATSSSCTGNAATASNMAVSGLTGFPGGTTNFLRADGTFAAPSIASPFNNLTVYNSTAQRAFNTVYTNSTGKTMFIHVTMTGTCVLYGYIGSNIIANSNTGGTAPASAIITLMVPTGSTYKIVAASGTPAYGYWVESY